VVKLGRAVRSRLHLRFAVTAAALGGVTFGCASTRASRALTPPESTLSSRPMGGLHADQVVGVWALTDRRNSTFNVRLSADGRAIRTLSAGSNEAIGERGRWTLVDGRVAIDWDTGWQDNLAVGLMGVEQWSWAPGSDRTALPSSFGMAVPIRDEMTDFVGVWQLPRFVPGDPATIAVAIQSDGMVFRSAGDPRYGCWSPSERTTARITWANGWYDEWTMDDEGTLVRSWAPGTDRAGEPTLTNRARQES
jgi:hypothetical protein